MTHIPDQQNPPMSWITWLSVSVETLFNRHFPALPELASTTSKAYMLSLDATSDIQNHVKAIEAQNPK